MKKIKLMIFCAAVITGVGTAVVTNAIPPSDNIKHDWMDWNGETVIVNATQAEAQDLCAPSSAICLRARDNLFIHTTGVLPW